TVVEHERDVARRAERLGDVGQDEAFQVGIACQKHYSGAPLGRCQAVWCVEHPVEADAIAVEADLLDWRHRPGPAHLQSVLDVLACDGTLRTRPDEATQVE